MWPDNETANDLLGFQVHADLIRAVVTDPKMLPLTLGVFGDWGGGKTSIMRMLERDLEPDRWPEGSDERIVCEGLAVVYVNTWLFEGYDDAKTALLSAVLVSLAEHKRFGPKLRDGAVGLLKAVDWMRLAGLAFKHVAVPAAMAFASGGSAAIPAAVALSNGVSNLINDWPGAVGKDPAPGVDSAIKKSEGAQEKGVRKFRERFGKLLADSNIRSLVVLIDDLDRCTPERIVENLEAIKLFLSVEQSAFVIGADRRIVEHAIRLRYANAANDSGSDESNRLVKDYLEKLIQVPYALPRLSATEIQTYMSLLFCQRHLTEDSFSLCLAACLESRDRNRYGSFGYGDVVEALKGEAMPSSLGDALAFSTTAAPLVADGLKGNPRQVKRFLNALLLRKELARVARLRNVRDDVLIKLMILEYTHLDRFTELFAAQAVENGQPKLLRDLESLVAEPIVDLRNDEPAKSHPKWLSSALRRWVAMEPTLKEIDLRDYFWVARDQLHSTFSGIAMVPPIVRATFDDLLSSQLPRRHEGVRGATTLKDEELATLLELLNQHVTRAPGEKLGYDALRALAEGGVLGAADLLAKILVNRPLEKMPTTVGLDIMNLLRAKPELLSIFEPVKKRLLESDHLRIGKAAKSAHRTG